MLKNASQKVIQLIGKLLAKRSNIRFTTVFEPTDSGGHFKTGISLLHTIVSY